MGYKPDWQNGSMKKPAGHKCSPGMQSRELFHGAKKGLPGFADGEIVDASNLPELREPTAADRGESTSVADLPELREPTAADRGEAAAPKNFGAAFKDARASGAKEFEFQGKKYTTEMKGESKPAAKKDSYDIEDGKFMDVKPAAAPEKKYTSGGRAGRVYEDSSSSGKTASDVRRGKPSLSLKNTGGKYVPSTGVPVKK